MDEAIHIARKWLEAMNAQDVERMSSLCGEDAVGEEVASPPPAMGRDQIAKSYRELFEGFPDCKAEILNLFSGQDQVLAEVRWSGTNRADFRGTPATGRFVDIRIAYIFRVEKGRIRKITEYYDGAAVATQMGLS
ncbi:MAG TPA: ester cyclase [Thermodesulfobacteriota bacterium]|nr:ester cyclase [Thermodesulfobacteriota bacterium]